MSNNTEFMGQDGFIWFVGVVEDRQDPLKLGRVRVRCLGYHTENVNELPTSDLPWASPLLPITSSGINGIGQTPLGLLEGSWVVGFFKDADTIILCPIFTAGEKIKLGFHYNDFAKEIIKNSKVKLFMIKNNIELAKFLKQNIYGNKIVIGMGAGTISNWMKKLPELM